MKLNFDFSPHFWIGLFFFVCSAIGAGTIHLTGAVPDDWIRPITAWASIFSVIGSGYMAAAVGLHNADPQVRRELVAAQPNTMIVTTANDGLPALANKLAAIPEIKNVISTPEVASVTTDKVISATELPKG